MRRLEEHELLGEGAFGQVYKATVHDLATARKITVAVKKLKGCHQRFLFHTLSNNQCLENSVAHEHMYIGVTSQASLYTFAMCAYIAFIYPPVIYFFI